jgi:hypothetical protein
MIPDFAMMNRSEGFGFGDATRINGSVNNPMVTEFHTAGNFALNVSQRVCEDG